MWIIHSPALSPTARLQSQTGSIMSNLLFLVCRWERRSGYPPSEFASWPATQSSHPSSFFHYLFSFAFPILLLLPYSPSSSTSTLAFTYACVRISTRSGTVLAFGGDGVTSPLARKTVATPFSCALTLNLPSAQSSQPSRQPELAIQHYTRSVSLQTLTQDT